MGTFVLHAAAMLLVGLRAATCLVYDPVEYHSFCPYNPCRPPESHHVCKFFDSKIERKCDAYPFLLEFNDTDVEIMVDSINEYRMLVANGSALAKDGELLPRGYGMIRMPLQTKYTCTVLQQWDRQLAGMAKLTVETCHGNGLCAKTNKFSNTRSVSFNGVRATVMSATIAAQGLGINLGLSLPRVLISDVTHCPDGICGTRWNGNHAFCHSVQSNAKFFGCAASYGIHRREGDNRTEQSYFNCHVSHYTEVGQPVYNMTPPQLETGFTNMCGCPLYHREIDGCLCERYTPSTVSTPAFFDFPNYTKKRIRGPTEPQRAADPG